MDLFAVTGNFMYICILNHRDMNPLSYPLGIQTFSEIIEGNYLYVDKTNLIFQLVSSLKYVFLSRPRRFGKSLLLSTVQEYFKGNKSLFQGLSIYELEKNWESHPVIRFDLSAQSYDNIDKLKNHSLENWMIENISSL